MSFPEPYYEHAGITIYLGDSRDLVPLVRGVDTVVTSPPYSQQRRYGADEPFDWDGVVPAVMAGVVGEPGCQMLINLGQVWRNGELCEYWHTMDAALRDHGWRKAAQYVWDKTCGIPGTYDGRLWNTHEWVFQWYQQRREAVRWWPTTNGGQQITESSFRVRTSSGDVNTKSTTTKTGTPSSYHRAMGSVIEVSAVRSNIERTGHPAQMPVKLATQLIRSWPGTVLDPFMGSGTTLVAAKRLGCKAIGIEQSEEYCEMAVQRLAQEVLPL